MKKVFLDASVIFSAIYSEKGGSRRIISLIKSNHLVGITSQTVIQELKGNLQKLKTESSQVDIFIAEYRLLVREEITQEELRSFEGLVDIKDVHVVAAAILTNCQYLITLDKKHLDNLKTQKKISRVQILSPKAFIKII